MLKLEIVSTCYTSGFILYFFIWIHPSVAPFGVMSDTLLKATWPAWINFSKKTEQCFESGHNLVAIQTILCFLLIDLNTSAIFNNINNSFLQMSNILMMLPNQFKVESSFEIISCHICIMKFMGKISLWYS